MAQMNETSQPGRKLSDLANPAGFTAFAGLVLPWLGGLAAILLITGLAMGFAAPEDYQQGITVRIMYIHVPFAWLSMMIYGVMAVSAVGSLVWRHPLADLSIRAAAPLGAVFTLLALVTGSVWGRPMWGAWWVWDARLTSVFILLLMYLGLIALTRAFDEPQKAARAAAILVLIGSINLPIIKFSVEWWNTLHQPASVLRLDGPTIHPSLLWPLLISAAGFTCLFFTLHVVAMRTGILRRRIAAMRRIAAREAESRS